MFGTKPDFCAITPTRSRRSSGRFSSSVIPNLLSATAAPHLPDPRAGSADPPGCTIMRSSRCRPGSGHELQQRAVHLIVVSPRDRVRSALDDHHLHVAEQARQPLAGIRVRQDPVVVSLVGMQATAAVADADTAMFQLAW